MIRKAFKYCFKHCRSFDISPIESGGLSKFFLYLIWGFNLAAFAGTALIQDNPFQQVNNNNGSIIYNVEKKVSAKDFYTESIELINDSFFIVISSYDYEIPQFDVLIIPTGRAPPFAV